MAEDQRVVFQNFLNSLGLGHMSDLLEQAVQNDWTPTVLQQHVYNDDRFKSQFPEYWARINAGLPEMTPGQIREYRSTAKRLFKDAQMPADFYDQDSDFSTLITGNVDLEQLGRRIESGFMKVAAAPPEVRSAFQSFFGPQGDSALAAFFLDPEKGESVLLKAVTQAEISGAGKRFGFDIDLAEATALQSNRVTGESAMRGFDQASQLRPLSEETITETTDITDEDLIDTAFGLDDDGRNAMERRQRERTSAFQGGGGAAQTQRGFGSGAAR